MKIKFEILIFLIFNILQHNLLILFGIKYNIKTGNMDFYYTSFIMTKIIQKVCILRGYKNSIRN